MKQSANLKGLFQLIFEYETSRSVDKRSIKWPECMDGARTESGSWI